MCFSLRGLCLSLIRKIDNFLVFYPNGPKQQKITRQTETVVEILLYFLIEPN